VVDLLSMLVLLGPELQYCGAVCIALSLDFGLANEALRLHAEDEVMMTLYCYVDGQLIAKPTLASCGCGRRDWNRLK